MCIRATELTRNPGHTAKDCTNNRVFDLSGIVEATAEVAWTNLQKADEEKDLDDIRNVNDSSNSSFNMLTWFQAIKVYSKAIPQTTYEQLERAFRTNNMNTYLIAFVSGLP